SRQRRTALPPTSLSINCSPRCPLPDLMTHPMTYSMNNTLNNNLNPRGAYSDLASLLRLRFGARDLKLFAQRPARSLLTGGERTRFRGRGMDFEEVRLYQPGDAIRSIDWRVTARTQVP